MHPLHVAFFRNKSGVQPAIRILPWEELREVLTQHSIRTEKDFYLFSLVEYEEGTTRKNVNVRRLYGFVADFDNGTPPDDYLPRWSRWEYVVYSTFSHTPKKPKWRAVFPFQNTVDSSDWPRVFDALTHLFGSDATDKHCRDVSRMYYLPARGEEAESFVHVNAGEWLDPWEFVEREQEQAPTPAPRLNGTVVRPRRDLLLAQALDKHHGGRNNAGLWLACQLRDNQFAFEEAEDVMLEYQRFVPQGDRDPYTEREALDTLRKAYARTAREPWKTSTPWPITIGTAVEEPGTMTLEKARELVTTACMVLKDKPEQLFEQDTLQALALMKRYQPGVWEPFRAKIQRGRISLKALYSALPQGVQLAPEDRAQYGGADQDASSRTRYAGDMLDDCPTPTLVIPDPYYLRWNATGRMGTDEFGQPKPVTIAFAPVIITGRMRDAVTGSESLLLSWKWPAAGWHSRVVERSHVLTGRKLTELSSVGFPVGDDSSKGMVGYLHRLEAANRPTLPCASVSSHLGWQTTTAGTIDDATFLLGRTLILPDGSVEDAQLLDVEHPEGWNEKRVYFHGVGEGEEQIVAAFHRIGSFEEWRRCVAVLKPYPKALVALYAAFCAPLLGVFNVPNFIVDWSNRTSTGKTTILRVAGSVWGSPDERQASSVIGTWDATRVWTERASHVLSGLPLIMDDTKKAKHSRMVAELIYAVTSGRGRGRGNIHGIAQTATWRTVMLSTGEQPATSFTQDGGTRTRVLAICGMPFEGATVETGKMVTKLNIALCQHYGHAGSQFLQWLQKNRHTWPEWTARYAALQDKYAERSNASEAGRLAQYAALVTIAGEMAHRALGLPWEFTDPISTLWDELAEQAADAAGDARALEHVISWAHSNERTFIGRTPKSFLTQEPMGGNVFSGRWDDGNWRFIAFYPNVLKRVLREEGFNAESILAGWREQGWIVCDKSKFTCDVRIPSGETPKMVKILRTAVESVIVQTETADEEE